MSVTERHAVCALLHADRFVDKAPAQVYALLLDEIGAAEEVVCSS